MMNDYVVHVTAEEYTAMNDLVKKMRAEEARKQAIKNARMTIGFEVSHAISEIGLEETKHIIREISRELKSVSENNEFPF